MQKSTKYVSTNTKIYYDTAFISNIIIVQKIDTKHTRIKQLASELKTVTLRYSNFNLDLISHDKPGTCNWKY